MNKMLEPEFARWRVIFDRKEKTEQIKNELFFKDEFEKPDMLYKGFIFALSAKFYWYDSKARFSGLNFLSAADSEPPF